MSASRLLLWDLEAHELTTYQDEVLTRRGLSDPSRGGLQFYTMSKIKKHLAELNLSKEEIEDILRSPPIYNIISEFGAYEKFKNAVDAKVTKVYLNLKYDPLKKILVVTQYDNGKGVKDFLEAKDRSSLLDTERGLDYFKLISPGFDATKKEDEKNMFTRGRFKSDKALTIGEPASVKTDLEVAEEEKVNLSGGRALGLRAEAILAHATGGLEKLDSEFKMIDMPDFKKSKVYQELTGIEDVSELPDKGAVIISVSPVFSDKFYQEFKQKSLEYIQTKGSVENNYFCYLKVEEIEAIYKMKKGAKKNKIERIKEDSNLSDSQRSISKKAQLKTEAPGGLQLDIDALDQSGSQHPSQLTSTPHAQQSPNSTSELFLDTLPTVMITTPTSTTKTFQADTGQLGTPISQNNNLHTNVRISVNSTSLSPRTKYIDVSTKSNKSKLFSSQSVSPRPKLASLLQPAVISTPPRVTPPPVVKPIDVDPIVLSAIPEEKVKAKITPAIPSYKEDPRYTLVQEKIKEIERKLALPTRSLFSLSGERAYAPFKKREKETELQFLKSLRKLIEKSSVEEAFKKVKKDTINLYNAYGKQIEEMGQEPSIKQKI